MAIIKLGPTIIGIRGTVGGITFSANKSGPIARAWSRGANPRSTRQTTARSLLAAIPQLWRDLSPAEQTAWDTFAALPAQELFNRLGESFFGSGFLWFTKINTRLLTIGRSTRVAVPVAARPSPPTISSLELPYLDAQGAYITYPAAEFGATFDAIIELQQALSIGRQVPSGSFLTIKEDQDPGDTATAFLLPYIDRFGIGAANLKGFARVYRQTDDGLRSAPTAIDFISTDAPPYVATAKDYNGTTNWATHGQDLDGNADSKVLTLSIWFRIDGGDGTDRYIASTTSNYYYFRFLTTNQFEFQVANLSGIRTIRANTTTAFTSGPAWHNIICSVDVATSRIQFAVDGIPETPVVTTAPTDVLLKWTSVNQRFGALGAGNLPFNGCIAEYYFNTAESLDIEAPNALQLFISPAGSPMYLGPDGAFPTGSQPIVYFSAADPEANLGYGGNYINNAALTNCSDAP